MPERTRHKASTYHRRCALSGGDRPIGFGIQAQAAITTFVDDKAGFLAATGATSATGFLPDRGGPFTGSQKVGSVTFARAPPPIGFYIGGGGLRLGRKGRAKF